MKYKCTLRAKKVNASVKCIGCGLTYLKGTVVINISFVACLCERCIHNAAILLVNNRN